MYLEKIDGPKALKDLSLNELKTLAVEIRSALLAKGSAVGGHLASNLGVVEMTIALHYVYDSPLDKIIFDVSHQTYVHKMLTGRAQAFLDKDAYGSVSGYTNPAESDSDVFSLGHTSTSIGLACGLAKARAINGGSESIIAVIGDSSLDGGVSFEALNYLGEMGEPLVIVVNDNDMSIPENHGSLRGELARLRGGESKDGGSYFSSFGFDYEYVEDGHDIRGLIDAFERAKTCQKPIVVHVHTIKGKGYAPAEGNPEKWHWAHPFDIERGEFTSDVPTENYGAIARDYLLSKMDSDERVAVVAASTPLCIGFDAAARKRAGNQFVDVGIAEQNAVLFTAGLARGGCKPVFATNSTFYQRAYDQIEQEICVNQLPVTMIVTHTGVYGHTNDTHTGLLDISQLGNIPGLLYLAPTNKEEYLGMLDWAIDQGEVPVAIRVPWMGVKHADAPVDADYGKVNYSLVRSGERVAIFALGSFFPLGEELADMLRERCGVEATLVNPRFISGLDRDLIDALVESHDIFVTIEDGILAGGFGSKIASTLGATAARVLNCGFSQDIPNRYDPRALMLENGIDAAQILQDVERLLD